MKRTTKQLPVKMRETLFTFGHKIAKQYKRTEKEKNNFYGEKKKESRSKHYFSRALRNELWQRESDARGQSVRNTEVHENAQHELNSHNQKDLENQCVYINKVQISKHLNIKQMKNEKVAEDGKTDAHQLQGHLRLTHMLTFLPQPLLNRMSES